MEELEPVVTDVPIEENQSTPLPSPTDELIGEEVQRPLEPTIIYEGMDTVQMEGLLTDLNTSVVLLNEQIAKQNYYIEFSLNGVIGLLVFILFYKVIKSFI